MKIFTHKVAAIIPACNEESRIGTVLEVVTQADVVDEIIVVNDGSTDKTAQVAKSFPGVYLIDKRSNEGKGAALTTGIENTGCDILVFIDADLVGFKVRHIEDLVNPLLQEDDLMMTVGKFSGGRLRTDLSQTLIPSISGQRALRRSFMEGINFSEAGFGVEIALTRYAQQSGAKIKEVIINDVTHITKEEKLGIAKGTWARLGMYSDMVKNYLLARS